MVRPIGAPPIALDSIALVGLWDLQLVHQEAGHEGQVNRWVGRLWAPDSAIRAQLWLLRRHRPGLLAVGNAATGGGQPDSVFRWVGDGQHVPLVVLDSAFVLGDPPGGFDGSREYLTVRQVEGNVLRGRWTSAYFGVAVSVDGRPPPPDPNGYFCATRR